MGGQGEKRRRREWNKPLDLLEHDQVLTPFSMEVSFVWWLFVHDILQ